MCKEENPDNLLNKKFGLPKQKAPENLSIEKEKEQFIQKQKLDKYIKNTKHFQNLQEDFPLFKNRTYSEMIHQMARDDPEFKKRLFEQPEFYKSLNLDYVAKKSERRAYNRHLTRKYGNTGSMFLRGKIGIDVFFILFGIVGVVAIPSFFYYKNSNLRNKFVNLYKNEEFRKKMEDMDLDERSPSFSGRDMEGMRREALEKARIQEELGNL